MSPFHILQWALLLGPLYLWEYAASIIFRKPIWRGERAPVMPSGLRCKAVLIMEAVKMKVSIFLLRGGERSAYKMFLNETLPNGVLISGLVTVFDYRVPFQLCGGLLCRVRNIPPQLPPQQYPSGTLEAQVPLRWLIVTCQDCQPHFTAIYQRVGNCSLQREREKLMWSILNKGATRALIW